MRQITPLGLIAKTKSFVLAGAAFLLCAALVISCSKGNTGPAGPAGADGATGPKGATGSPNVIYSAWQYGNAIRDTTVDGSALKVSTILAPQLVDSIINKGTILVYFTFGAGTFPMPYTSYAGGKANTISFLPQPGKIFITRFTLDNSNSIALSSILQYRYILIPGGVLGGRLAAVDYSKMSYEQVCEYLHIPL